MIVALIVAPDRRRSLANRSAGPDRRPGHSRLAGVFVAALGIAAGCVGGPRAAEGPAAGIAAVRTAEGNVGGIGSASAASGPAAGIAAVEARIDQLQARLDVAAVRIESASSQAAGRDLAGRNQIGAGARSTEGTPAWLWALAIVAGVVIVIAFLAAYRRLIGEVRESAYEVGKRRWLTREAARSSKSPSD